MTPLLLGLAFQPLRISFDAVRSAANVATDPILLLVQRPLFRAGDMAMVLCGREAFFTPHEAILLVKRIGLGGVDLAFAQFAIDPVRLIGEAVIHFGATRMSLLPGGGGRAATHAQKKPE
jgi:hypothetical protein